MGVDSVSGAPTLGHSSDEVTVRGEESHHPIPEEIHLEEVPCRGREYLTRENRIRSGEFAAIDGTEVFGARMPRLSQAAARTAAWVAASLSLFLRFVFPFFLNFTLWVFCFCETCRGISLSLS